LSGLLLPDETQRVWKKRNSSDAAEKISKVGSVSFDGDFLAKVLSQL
jgi:hypothetical protein